MYTANLLYTPRGTHDKQTFGLIQETEGGEGKEEKPMLCGLNLY